MLDLLFTVIFMRIDKRCVRIAGFAVKHGRHFHNFCIRDSLRTQLPDCFRFIGFGWDRRDAVHGFYILIPILIDRVEHSDIVVALAFENVFDAMASADACVIVVKAQHDLRELGIHLQSVQYRTFRNRAQCHIRVILPIVLMQSYKRKPLFFLTCSVTF